MHLSFFSFHLACKPDALIFSRAGGSFARANSFWCKPYMMPQELLFSFGCTYIYMPILTSFTSLFYLLFGHLVLLQGIHGWKGSALEEGTLIVIFACYVPFSKWRLWRNVLHTIWISAWGFIAWDCHWAYGDRHIAHKWNIKRLALFSSYFVLCVGWMRCWPTWLGNRTRREFSWIELRAAGLVKFLIRIRFPTDHCYNEIHRKLTVQLP